MRRFRLVFAELLKIRSFAKILRRFPLCNNLYRLISFAKPELPIHRRLRRARNAASRRVSPVFLFVLQNIYQNRNGLAKKPGTDLKDRHSRLRQILVFVGQKIFGRENLRFIFLDDLRDLTDGTRRRTAQKLFRLRSGVFAESLSVHQPPKRRRSRRAQRLSAVRTSKILSFWRICRRELTAEASPTLPSA